MKEKICYEILANVAIIHTGINIVTLRRKGLSPEEADPKYGSQKNDILIKKNMYSTGKKVAFIVTKKTSVSIIPDGNTFIIHPDSRKINPIYLKAFLEFIPSLSVHTSIKTKLLTKRCLEKLLIPLPELAIQESLIREYSGYELSGTLKENSNNSEQYKALKKIFWNQK
jgi:hypothetical protein